MLLQVLNALESALAWPEVVVGAIKIQLFSVCVCVCVGSAVPLGHIIEQVKVKGHFVISGTPT